MDISEINVFELSWMGMYADGEVLRWGVTVILNVYNGIGDVF